MIDLTHAKTYQQIKNKLLHAHIISTSHASDYLILIQLTDYYMQTGSSRAIDSITVYENRLKLEKLSNKLLSIRAKYNWLRARSSIQKTNLIAQKGQAAIDEGDYMEGRGIIDPLSTGKLLRPHEYYSQSIRVLMKSYLFWSCAAVWYWNNRSKYPNFTAFNVDFLVFVVARGYAAEFVIESTVSNDEKIHLMKHIRGVNQELDTMRHVNGNVKYFDEHERGNFEVVYAANSLNYANGNALPLGVGLCSVVVAGRHFMTPKKRGTHNHTSLSGGHPVDSAAILYKFGVNDYHVEIASGHYYPGFRELLYELTFFRENNLAFTLGNILANDKVKLSDIIPFSSPLWGYVEYDDDSAQRSPYIKSRIIFRDGGKHFIQILQKLYNFWVVRSSSSVKELILQNRRLLSEVSTLRCFDTMARLKVNYPQENQFLSSCGSIGTFIRQKHIISFDEFVVLAVHSPTLQAHCDINCVAKRARRPG